MMRKFSLVIMMVILMTLAACSQNITDKDISNETFSDKDTVDETFSDVSHQTTSINENNNENSNENNNVEENTSAPPTDQVTTQTFESIRAMKEEIDEKRNNGSQSSLFVSSTIDTSNLKELKGLNTDYTESWVEWSGGDTYAIYYTATGFVLAFIPFPSENLLQEEMENWLLSDGTYENLLANHLVTNVEFENLPTTAGTSYQCTYNTGKVTGLILRYHTYTDPDSNITYILSETLSPDNQLQSKSLFVFDGDKSFMCNGNDVNLTVSTACNLYSSNVQ